MSDTTPMPSDPSLAAQATDSNTVIIKNNFGEFHFERDKAILMPQGLVGLPEHQEFALTSFPNERMGGFKLFQCLSSDSLSFVVLPANPEACAIDAADIAEACKTLGIAQENLALLFIVTIRRMNNTISMTINLRAPVLIDSAKRLGRQYVLPNNKYSVREPLSAEPLEKSKG